jgi:signal transduction histidine kinase
MPTVSYSAVAFAAHALNNFLSVIGGTTELLGLVLANHPEPRVRTWLTALQNSTHMMGQIVAALMKDALIAGRSNITFAKVDLVAGLQTICFYYQTHADRKQIRLIWEPPEEAHCYAWTDNTALAAVMDNLLSNAMKYSPYGGRVWVSLQCDAEAHVCSVRDEGPGISAADQERLFQRGVRLSATPTGGEASHGYGLAVAKELLDLVGGTIWCESEYGAGATFRFRVPAYSGQLEGSR